MQKALHQKNHVYMIVNFMNCAHFNTVSLKFEQIHFCPCYDFSAPWICIITDIKIDSKFSGKFDRYKTFRNSR